MRIFRERYQSGNREMKNLMRNEWQIFKIGGRKQNALSLLGKVL